MKCAVHGEVDATGFCRNCGKAMCAACVRPVRDVEAAFLAIRLPAGRVRDPMEAADDGELRARGLLTELRHPHAPADRPSGFLGASLPIVFAGRVDLPPAELLGTSTDAVLRTVAGCTDEHADFQVDHAARRVGRECASFG